MPASLRPLAPLPLMKPPNAVLASRDVPSEATRPVAGNAATLASLVAVKVCLPAAGPDRRRLEGLSPPFLAGHGPSLRPLSPTAAGGPLPPSPRLADNIARLALRDAMLPSLRSPSSETWLRPLISPPLRPSSLADSFGKRHTVAAKLEMAMAKHACPSQRPE